MKQDIREAIDIVRELAKSLIKVSKIRKMKYPFLRIHLEKIIKLWKNTNSKYEIHLFDLPNDTIIDLNKNNEMCKLLCGKNNGIEIKTLKNRKLSISDINELEKNTISIRTRRSKKLKLSGLPIKLNNDRWAYIFGYLPDAGVRRFDFYSKNDVILSEMKTVLNKLNCQYSEFPNRVVANKIFTRILLLSGININKKQNMANNTLPPWIFTKTSESFKRILVTKFFESEGYLSKNSRQANITQTNNMQLPQNVFIRIKKIGKEYIIKPSNVKILKINYNNLPEDVKNTIISNPCAILISLQLLLKKLRVNSFINPEYLYINSVDITNIVWNLRIFGTDLDKFVEICSPYAVSNKFNNFHKRRETFSKNTKKLFYLLHAKIIENKQGYFTIKNMVNITGKNRKTVYNNISFLQKDGSIEKVGKNRRDYLQRITCKGLKFLENNKTCDE